jgi:hypothetical protein
VGSFHFAVQPWGAGPDFDVIDALVAQVVVERGAELRSVEFLTDVKLLRLACLDEPVDGSTL